MKCPACGHEWNSRAKVVHPVGELMGFFVQECNRIKGFVPSINQTKDVSACARVLKSMFFEDAKKAITHFLESDKSDKVGITLSAALSTHSINMYLHNKETGNGIDRYKRVIRNQGSGDSSKT